MLGAIAVILKYLWFIAIPVGLLGIILFKWRKAHVLAEKGVALHEANAAYRVIAIAVVACAGGIGLTQLAGDINSPFFLYSGNLENTYVVAGKGVLGLFWLGLLVWVWGSQQFVTYARLILPRRAMVLLPLAKPAATLMAVIGLSLLVFYQGNRVPFAIVNQSPQAIEWVALLHEDARYRIDHIPQQQPTIHNVPVNGGGDFKIQYKLQDSDSTWQAAVPFTISEFSMGFVQLVFNQDGKLHIADRRLLR